MDGIIANGRSTYENFDGHHIEALISRIFCKAPFLMQVNYLERTSEPFNMNVREWFRRIETINIYMPYVESYIESIN